MRTLGIAAGAIVCATATSAFAQTSPAANPPPGEPARDVRDVLTAPVAAPKKAFELGVEAGYTQGFGALTIDPRVGAGAGGTVGMSLGYRATPRWSVGASGQYQSYRSSGTQPNASSLRGVTADVMGTYHMTPYNRLDPYVSIGAGYRLFVESPAGNVPSTLTHALEVGKVEIGLDVRPSDSVAISPVIGADMNLFAWRGAGGGPTAVLSNKTVNTFVFAGVKGRFDVGGTRENKPAPQTPPPQ